MASLNGAVAAAHPLAAQAGIEIMIRGGNAFDAAAACAAALNVVEPQMSGLAGMGLATCYIAATGKVATLNFIPPVGSQFVLPVDARREDLVRGGLGVGAPGALAGWCKLNADHGLLPWADILAPAIRLAREGFPLLELNAFCIADTHAQLRSIPSMHGGWAQIYRPEGNDPRPGDVLRQPDLARTLTEIAASGPAYLYSGPLGDALVAHVRALGGTIDVSDLETFAPAWQKPASIDYRGHSIHISPPPSQGFQVLLALRLLEAIDFSSLPRNGVEHLDVVLRAIRLAAGVRIAQDNPDATQLSAMLDQVHIDDLRRRMLSDEPVFGPVESGDGAKPTSAAAPEHTTSFSVADRAGNMVCLTQSLGQFFGSGVVVPGTGVCLNDMPAFGDISPDSATAMRPGQPFVQPMSPSIVTRNGEPVLALGTPGSFGIMQTQVQALVQMIDYGQPPQAAISAPRIRLWDGARIEVEARIEASVIEDLKRRGHEVQLAADWTTKVGGMHAISRNPDTGVLTGGFDPRRDGTVALL